MIFCDALNLTFPLDAGDVLPFLSPYFDAAGFCVELSAKAKGDLSVFRHSGGGLLRHEVKYGVQCLTLSGGACRALRDSAQWLGFLAACGSFPHRVTRMDATHDRFSDAAPLIRKAARRGQQGRVRLSSRSVPATAVSTVLALDARGVRTGTVYLGSPKADVRLTVYDKRKEREDKHYEDPGPWVRYELRLRGGGHGVSITLRDVAEPASIFWHFMDAGVLPRPDGVPAWVNGRAEGYVLERREAPTAFQRLRSRVESSAEMLALVKLAGEIGPYGVNVLKQEIDRLAGSQSISGGEGVSPSASSAQGA